MPQFIELKPDYVQTTRMLARSVASGGHERPYLAMSSIIDQVRYLAQNGQISSIQRIVDELKWIDETAGTPPRDPDLELKTQYSDTSDRWHEDLDR